MKWIETAKELPKENTIVDTKIDDGRGIRNQARLKRIGRLWFVPNGSIYVYYTPTHWQRPNGDADA